MVIETRRHSPHGWLVAELVIAITVMAVAMIPLAFSFRGEQKMVRGHYNQVVAMEIIDGEMEFLCAGQWRSFLEGEQDYQVTAAAATNLPQGRFLLTRSNQLLRLEWRPAKRSQGGPLRREILIPH